MIVPVFTNNCFRDGGSQVRSTAVRTMSVDPLRGTAAVIYQDSNKLYTYTNVSRRAIIKFMIDDARSLGKFINNVLKQARVQCHDNGWYQQYV
jgi:hypothetical protein